MTKLYIIAWSYKSAIEYAIDKGFKESQIRFIDSWDCVRGLKDIEIVVLKGAEPLLVNAIKRKFQLKGITFKMENRK